MQARRGSFGWLRSQLAHGTPQPPEQRYAVGLRDVPATKVASIRAEVDQQHLVDTIRSAEWSIRGHLGRQGVASTAEHWVIYHGPVTPDSEAVIEVCLPFTGSAEPDGEIIIRLEPAHREAFATVIRDDCFYPRIMRAYEAVAAYTAARGLLLTGPEREIYIDFWDQIAGTDPFVYVATPIEG
jgi:effector-binding domain-containing protein